MLRIIQIIALLATALIVSEAALWMSWYHEAEKFSLILSALLGYASLLSLVFFGDKIKWLGKVLTALWSLSLSSLLRAVSTSLLLITVSVFFAQVLYTKWETTEFNVIFEIDPKKNKIPENSTMQVEDIHTQESVVMIIEANGRARFSVTKDSVVQVSTVLGKAQYVFQPVQIEKIPFYRPLDLNNAERLIESVPGSAHESSLASYSLPQSYFRQFNLGYSTKLQYTQKRKHVLHGLPGQSSLIEKRGYIFSFNKILRIPNWVAYWLNGTRKRINRPARFIQEPLIDASVQASSTDYRGSGYDRGHLVSIGDMTFLGEQEVKEANNMATIVPQSRYLNRNAWLSLEKLARKYAENGVGIIAGPIFQGKNNKVQLITIGGNNIGVPTHLFRIIYRRNADSMIDVMAFIIPNSDDLSTDLKKYMVSVDEIEKLTGLDFFNTLNPEYQDKIESNIPSLWAI